MAKPRAIPSVQGRTQTVGWNKPYKEKPAETQSRRAINRQRKNDYLEIQKEKRRGKKESG